MKDNKNTNVNVPCIHSGCNLAETGASDYDNFDAPLGALDITEGQDVQLVEERNQRDGFDGPYVEVKVTLPPQVQNPADVREEPMVTITVPSGVHPITFLKEKGVEITKAWVFMDSNVVKTLRKLPRRYHQNTVAYGEFFRFENLDTISLQEVKYFDHWHVLLEWEFNGEKLQRPEIPETIIEVVME